MTSAAGAVMLEAKEKTRSECLVMANLSLHPLEEWVKAMQEAGQPWSSAIITELTQARVFLQRDPACYVVICFDSPDYRIANDIGLGRMPSQALANWKNWAESLLELYRDNYHRMTLVSYAGLYHETKTLCEQLTSRSGIALGKVPVQAPAQLPLEPYEQQQLTTHLLLAQQAMAEPSTQRLVSELEVSTLALLQGESSLDRLDRIFEQHQQLLTTMPKFTAADYEEKATKVECLETEKKKWLQEKKLLQKAVEEGSLDGKSKEKLEDLQHENDMIIRQLHNTQEELEQYILGKKGGGEKLKNLEQVVKQKNEKLHAFSQKNKQLTEKLKQTRQELASIRKSKSWKITAPLRKITKLFGGSS